MIGAFGTTLVGGTVATIPPPQTIEIAAGALRVKTGAGEKFKIYIAKPSALSLTIAINDHKKLVIKF